MNRKAGNIIFYIFVGIFTLVFFATLILGGIASFAGAGTTVYKTMREILETFGLKVKTAPYLCVGIGFVLCFMFYRKYNRRIN